METSPRRDLALACAGPNLESPKWGGGALTLKTPRRGHEEAVASPSLIGLVGAGLGELLNGSEIQRAKKSLCRRAVLTLGVGVCDERS